MSPLQPIDGDVIIESIDNDLYTIRIEGQPDTMFGGPFALDIAKEIGLMYAKQQLQWCYQKVGSDYARLFDPSEPHDSSYVVVIAGEFNGWTGDVVVVHTNGTKWKQAGPSQLGYQYRYNQVATFRQRTSGQFYIGIDGLGEMEVMRAY